MDPSARESGRWMEGRKNILNSPPSTSVRAPVTEPSPQQPNSAYRALRLMCIIRKFPQFDSRSIITVTEMDHRCPCFGKSDKHGVGHPRSAKKWEMHVLAASAYLVANATKLHPITTPIPAHHTPTMTLAQNNVLSFAATVPA